MKRRIGHRTLTISSWDWFRFRVNLDLLTHRSGSRLDVWCDFPEDGKPLIVCNIRSGIFDGTDLQATAVEDKAGLFADLAETCQQDIEWTLEDFPGLAGDISFSRDVQFRLVGSRQFSFRRPGIES